LLHRKLIVGRTNEGALIFFWGPISSHHFSELAPCSNGATIKILGFRQSGHGLISTPAAAQVYLEVQDAKIVWTKGFVAYGDL
jgi:hypothetical protein